MKSIPAANSTKNSAQQALSFYECFENLLNGFSQRSQDVMRKRFGVVNSGKTRTLEEIGKEYQITRERVRQIIRSILKDVQSKKNSTIFKQVFHHIEEKLQYNNGILEESALLHLLGGDDVRERGAVSFFLVCMSPMIQSIKEDDNINPSIALQDFSLDEWNSIHDDVKKFFTEEKTLLDQKNLAKRFVSNDSEKEIAKLFSYLAVSKIIRQNVFGKWGLVSWNTVQPKGTREKAYLVLESLQKPLHFREIASAIDKYGLQKSNKRQTHPQTVHNELIKDKRFVLIGRGTYALSQWGYKKGTVREVISDVLRESKVPLKRSEIIDRILKIRQVKKSTIVINLNTFFTKVGKDSYSLMV